jgi:hypothetical protein
MIFAACVLLAGCAQQQDFNAWQPSTKLPAEFVQTTRFLLQHGLEDPAGGQYVEATIESASIWNGQKTSTKVHAFQVGSSKRVVAWNGLAYDALSIGPLADLEADVAKAIAVPTPGYRIGPRGNTEGENALTLSHPIGVMILLRANRIDLAEKIFDHLKFTPKTGIYGRLDSYLFDPATQLFSNRFDRGLAAYMRGDDALARADFERIAQNLPALRAKADELLTVEFKERMSEPGYRHAFAFLDPVPKLSAYLNSDAANARKLDLVALKSKPQAQRIADLVAALSQVEERQWGQPGGVSIGSSPIVQALVQEGAPAVDALIDCMENDRRFTRSVSFGRDFFVDRNPISVAVAARTAVNAILGVNTSGNPGEAWTVSQIRNYWQANRGTTVEERWYRDLANDSADDNAWESAARKITERSDIVHTGNWMARPNRKPGQPLPPLKGEVLRKGKSPSVGELLNRRAIQLAGSGQIASSIDLFRARSGADIAIASYRWDAKGSLDCLQRVSRRLAELIANEHSRSQSNSLLYAVGRTFSARIEIGDPAALDEYSALLGSGSLKRQEGTPGDVSPLRVLWDHAGKPGIAALSRRVFNSPGSPWSIVEKVRAGEVYGPPQWLDSPLLLVPEFREALAHAIMDTTVAGTVTVEKQGTSYGYRYEAGNGGSGGTGGVKSEVPPEVVGKEMPLLASEMLLLHLQRVKDMPAFEIFWSDARKSAAKKQIAEFLRSNVDFKSLLPDHIWSRYEFER